MRGIVLFFSVLLSFTIICCKAQNTTGQIPIDPKRWYQLNNTSNGLEGLFDGTTQAVVETGWGKILSNYDAYYPLLDGETMQIDSIKFFDWQGSNPNEPFTLYAINDQWQRIHLATFTGVQYNDWVGPDPGSPQNDPNRFLVDTQVANIRYLVINTSGAYPTEMQLYGSYTAPNAIPPMPSKSIPLKHMLGVNAFEWDFEHPNNPLVIDPARLAAMKSFTQIRHYMDWEKLELASGLYTFNPCHSGGWNYDTLYATCKAEGIDVLADLKTIPHWMQITYPTQDADNENVPVIYGSDFSDPNSYILQAKVAFQFAARYGSNINVNPLLLSVNALPRWNGDPINIVKKGLDLVKYIECDNERDKWWKGRKAYQSGREYAANLSAFYDGHKNTMGPGVGVKNADPNMKVVMGGVAATTTDYLRGMIDWCKEFRGYKQNGEVDLCWDVINYHIYANDAGTSQGGNPTRGAAPEIAHIDSVAKNFVDIAHMYAHDMPVWVTETGYDEHQGSPLKAIPIGSKSVLETQADWILRIALLHARMGVERVFFYQTYDENLQNPGRFASSGLLNPNHTRKPAADYMVQLNHLLGEYVYDTTICSSGPIVDKYVLDTSIAYSLVKPTENGSTISYTLQLGNADEAKIYTPVPGQDTMNLQIVNVTNGMLPLTVTETPIFVIPVPAITTGQNTSITEETFVANAWERSVLLFPNPSADFINVQINNDVQEDAEVSIYTSAGQLCRKISIEKAAKTIMKRIDLRTFANGLYIVEIRQGTKTIAKRFLKTQA